LDKPEIDNTKEIMHVLELIDKKNKEITEIEKKIDELEK
jgi:hypothetical protein